MKKFVLFAFTAISLTSFVAGHAQTIINGDTISNNLYVTNNVDMNGAVFTQGAVTISSTVDYRLKIWDDASAVYFEQRKPTTNGDWLWQYNNGSTIVTSAKLDASNVLSLFNAGTAKVTLSPVSKALTLDTATLTGNGANLTAGAALTVTGAFTASSGITNSNGSFVGGTTGLNFSAGGTNQSITLTPTGTGSVQVRNAGTPSTLSTVLTDNAGTLILNGWNNVALQTGSTTRLFAQGSTGNVGIGTTAPVTKLDVQGGYISTADTGSSSRAFMEGGNGISYFGNIGTGDVYIGNANNWGYLTVKNGGNVGIGTQAPGTKFQVVGGQLGSETVSVITNYPSVTTNGTNYTRNLGFYSPNLNIASGVTDSGYRIGLDIENFVNDPSFLGTLSFQYGLWARVGSYSGGTGTIQNSYGVYIDNLDGPAIVANKFGLFQANATAKNYFAGTVGIGVSNPQQKLEVAGNVVVSGNVITRGGASDYFGIGEVMVSDLPANDIDLSRSNLSPAIGIFRVNHHTGLSFSAHSYYGGIRFYNQGYSTGSRDPYDSTVGGLLAMCITNGNVGIGTASPTQKLSVAGTVRAYSVVVDTGWSDYVFDKDYRLAPLSEVEQHIKAEKHLPGIPSAAEVAEHGVSLGDMQSKLLAKVEELTLHLIAQEKALTAVQSENASLRQRLANLEAAQR